MTSPFHTVVFSDVHLTTAVESDPERPLWKRYLHRDFFVDQEIADMLRHVRQNAKSKLEIVLNGDIFDFDAVSALPEKGDFLINWIEKIRGLNPTEVKSSWKLEAILNDHPEFVEALRDALREGHRVVFVVGNHDAELQWAGVQETLRERLRVADAEEVRICEWFYVSEGDTLIEHGHQYDPYCVCLDPVSPTIRVLPHGEARIRLPFGNYASRYMVNGMGMINPYAEKGFIMPFWGYVVFFYRHVARVQPLLAWTWMWTAVVTFVASLRDGILPAEKDVLHLDDRVEDIARRANATARIVRALDALKAHPAVFRPWKVARELWLDRLVLAMFVVVGSFQLLATLKVIVGISFAWWFLFLGFFLLPFLFYAHQVSSDADNLDRQLRRRIEMIGRVVGVERLVIGHTHHERHTRIDGVELLNSGTWSPAFKDVYCEERVGTMCIVRIRPNGDDAREASLERWHEDHFEVLDFQEDLGGKRRGLRFPKPVLNRR